MSNPEGVQTISTEPRGIWPVLLDLALVVGVLVVVKQSVLPYSLVYAGPASTFAAMIVATILLRRSGAGWGDLGFRWPTNWLATGAISVAVFVAFLAIAGASSALADVWFEDIGASGRFDFVEGNLPAYLLIMALVWTHGSFFEELLFRAFVISKLIDLLPSSRRAGIFAVVLAAIFFGYRHFYYQGAHGALVTGSIGLVFGLIYLKLRHTTIIPLIIVHGVANSIVQTSRFLG